MEKKVDLDSICSMLSDMEFCVQKRKDRLHEFLQVNTQDRDKTRWQLFNRLKQSLPDNQIEKVRVTKATGYRLVVHPATHGEEEVQIQVMKGAQCRRGTANEQCLLNLVQQLLEENETVNLGFESKTTGKKVDIKGITGIEDRSGKYAGNKRADNVFLTQDGEFSVSIKKENAMLVSSVRLILKPLMSTYGKIIRGYMRENGMDGNSYVSVPVTEEHLTELAWFGSDLKPNKGCVVIANFKNYTGVATNNSRIRVLDLICPEDGIANIQKRYPIYAVFHVDRGYKCELFRIMRLDGIVKNEIPVALPGINAPLGKGQMFREDGEMVASDTGECQGTLVEEPTLPDVSEPLQGSFLGAAPLTTKKKKKNESSDLGLQSFRMVTEEFLNTASPVFREIRDSALRRRMVWIHYKTLSGYTGNWLIEPYSFREHNNHNYLYGYDVSDRSIKCFATKRISRSKETSRMFRPRWEVEIESSKKELEGLVRHLRPL